MSEPSSSCSSSSVEPFSGAHIGRKRGRKRQVLENPKVHRIDPGTLRQDASWAASASSIRAHDRLEPLGGGGPQRNLCVGLCA